MPAPDPPTGSPADLDTGSLALFAGLAAADEVQRELDRQGFTGLRFSHGYVFQHLIDAEPTIGELAGKLAMTQQGASKAVAELQNLGYLERAADPRDARVRKVRLTSRGRDAVAAARRSRAALDERLAGRYGPERLAAIRAVLVDLIDDLGGTDAIRRREVRAPR
ncbi:MarR family winged helix-turn-helix transcriptional regulator [Actinomadura scrupuli]|uniref:MarR family winged helix-turn-helix transcriptional regulator n=1 Tax=Actinomadura scrupuli TaxID=559629 RepID=UPI003D989D3F